MPCAMAMVAPGPEAGRSVVRMRRVKRVPWPASARVAYERPRASHVHAMPEVMALKSVVDKDDR
jgi:hypothetical protein